MKKFNYELDYSRIKDLRINKKLKQSDIAKILNIDFTTYAHYENMDVMMPILKLNTLANFYNVTLDYIVGLNDNKKNSNKNKDIDRSIIALRIKEIRLKNNLYQETLAMDIGTSKSLICEYEKGKKLLSLPYAYAICKKYCVSMDCIYGKTDVNIYL